MTGGYAARPGGARGLAQPADRSPIHLHFRSAGGLRRPTPLRPWLGGKVGPSAGTLGTRTRKWKIYACVSSFDMPPAFNQKSDGSCRRVKAQEILIKEIVGGKVGEKVPSTPRST